MNTKQLKELGLDETQIAEVFKLNGLAIENAKSQVTSIEDDNAKLKLSVEELEAKLKEVIKPESHEELLNEKERLETELEDIKSSHAKEVEEIKFSNLLNNTLMKSGARSLEAVKAVISNEDMVYKDGKIEGLDEVISKAQEDFDYLFNIESNTDSLADKGVLKFTAPGKGTRSKNNSLDPFAKATSKILGNK